VADCGDPVLSLDTDEVVGARPRELRRIVDARGGIDWDVHMVDGMSERSYGPWRS
jgi:hypothetical protein